MRKGFRYKDGTFVMEGTEAWELKHNPPSTMKVPGARAGLDQHMKTLDDKWRKLEGRKPVAELNMREKMLEGRIPWDPVLLGVLNRIKVCVPHMEELSESEAWTWWERELAIPGMLEKLTTPGAPFGISIRVTGEPAFKRVGLSRSYNKDTMSGFSVNSEFPQPNPFPQIPHINYRLDDHIKLDPELEAALKEATDSALKGTGIPASELTTGLTPRGIIKEDIELLCKDVWEQLGSKPESLTDIIVQAKLDNFLGDGDVDLFGDFSMGSLPNPNAEERSEKYWTESSHYLFKHFNTEHALVLIEELSKAHPDVVTRLPDRALDVLTGRFNDTWRIRFGLYRKLLELLLLVHNVYIPYRGDRVIQGILTKSRFHPSGIQVNYPDGQY